MPAAVTVWAVELGRSPQEREGRLSLEADALVFTAANAAGSLRIPVSSIRSVKRLRGSPVLMVAHREAEGSTARTAFYFVQPPPLHPAKDAPTERAPNLFSGMGRTSKRKTRRANAGYLGMWGREKKAILVDWVDAIRSAASSSRA
ncbi:MAG: hypothetical protein ACE14W_05050 [Candidatus Velamenicoccus archaeovorus]